jgi:two-component system cell cycle sensor histidine kinase/response regulator CckA
MSAKRTNQREKCSELETLLEQERARVKYYQKIAQATGGKGLREIDKLSRIIADGKQTERALSESEEKYRTVLEASPDSVVVYDMEGEVIYLNPAFTRVFGWTLEELAGKTIGNVPEENQPETRMMIDKVMAGEAFSGIQSRRYTKGGSIVHVSISAAVYRDREGTPMGSVFNLRDITEQKKLEARLQQAQKMEAVGTLAGGIAHDFNNLLMAVQGNVSLMLFNVKPSHPYYERLKSIEKQIERGAKLTSQLLGYARRGKYEVKPISLNRLVEETADAFGRTKKEITIRRALAQDLFAMEADEGQIEQILLNLYVNAADAMPGGGQLVLKTRNATHEEITNKPYEVKPGNYVLLTVTDAGTGIDKATQQRIFEPFFTTKEMGRGTGLGLASVYGIVKGHGGYIDVNSRKGRGTTFSIYLPASEKRVSKPVKGSEQVIKGSETILLVDDEETVLDLGAQMLEQLGYTVIEAKGGAEAIEIYKTRRDDIDLVMLDMIMPEISGGEVCVAIKEINPQVRVLLSSGYSIEGQASAILKRGCDGFIQKPFSVERLSMSVGEILGKK